MVGRAKAKARRTAAQAAGAFSVAAAKARRKNLSPAEAARREMNCAKYRLQMATQQKLSAQTCSGFRAHVTQARGRAAKATSLEQDVNVRSVIKFGSNMKKLFQNPDFSDITFVVHGQKLFAHKNILAAQCEYFNVLFAPKSPFAESGCSEIEVMREWSHNAFVAVLEWLYTCHTPTDQSPQSMREVATIADFYNLPELKAVCGAILKRHGQPS